MYKIGIECHNLENKRWGTGRHLSKLLENIAQLADPQPQNNGAGLLNEFRFYLYFKECVPDDPYLNHPIFVKKILKLSWPRRPFFNIFFHLLLPIAYWRDHLNAMFFASFMLPAFFRGRSLVVLTNDIHYEYSQGHLPWRYRLGYALFANWAARCASQLTTYTQFAKDEIVRLFKVKPERISVNYPGLDRKQFFAVAASPKENYIFCLGQAFPRRHAKEIIEAFPLLANQFPDLKLILVGQDKYPIPTLKPLAQKINMQLGEERIIHYDYIQSDEDLLKLYQRARLFIYLSSSEALGWPPLEALAAGTASVVKNSPLAQEIFEDKVFVIADETDPVAIAQGISQALENTSSQKEILAHIDQLLAKFNWRLHTQRWLTEIKALCTK